MTDTLFLFLIPAVCFIMALSSMLGNKQKPESNITDLWFTTQDISDAYEAIQTEIEKWQKTASEEKTGGSSAVRRIFGLGGKKGERFKEEQSEAPRLYKVTDSILGSIYFELFEVNGGGTVVKSIYSSAARDKIVSFKSQQPIKIPATPIGNNCPTCGKPILREFSLCPYCGQKLIQE